jgi:hypothetical protein
VVDLDQPSSFGEIRIVWLGDDAAAFDDLVAVDAYDG